MINHEDTSCKYTPREERSTSKKLLDAFKGEIKNSEIEVLDLCIDVPDMFGVENMSAYIHRNYLKEEISSEQQKVLTKMDAMTRQTKICRYSCSCFSNA